MSKFKVEFDAALTGVIDELARRHSMSRVDILRSALTLYKRMSDRAVVRLAQKEPPADGTKVGSAETEPKGDVVEVEIVRPRTNRSPAVEAIMRKVHEQLAREYEQLAREEEAQQRQDQS